MNQEPQVNPAPAPNKTKSIVALVLGLVGIVLSFIPIGVAGAIISLICSICAIVFGAMGMKACPKGVDGHGLAVAGLVLGIIAVACAVIALICVIACVAAVSSAMNEAGVSWSDISSALQ